MYICICNAVSEKAIQNAVAEGTDCFESLQKHLGVGTCCGCCLEYARDYFEQCLTHKQGASLPSAPAPAANDEPASREGWGQLLSYAVL